MSKENIADDQPADSIVAFGLATGRLRAGRGGDLEPEHGPASNTDPRARRYRPTRA
ncbi:hypothetical protein [Streptomyces shenzhenensis]|uniref:hypothetical protein n=1 Tax=Streptomyces shenzhenensis TaxID=943815 RepID=UPI003407F3B6